MALEVIGIDPGEHTGLAYLRVDGDRRSFFSEQSYRHRAAGKLERHLRDVRQLSDVVDVACERFDIGVDTAKTARDAQVAIRTIGACEYVTIIHDYEFFTHGRADAKGLVQDGLLKALGFWNPGRGHANDAARQVVFHLAKRYHHIYEIMVKESGYLT